MNGISIPFLRLVAVTLWLVGLVVSAPSVAQVPGSDCAIPSRETLISADTSQEGYWRFDITASNQALGLRPRIPHACFRTDLRFTPNAEMALQTPQDRNAVRCRYHTPETFVWSLQKSVLAPGEISLLIEAAGSERRFRTCFRRKQGKPELVLTTDSPGESSRLLELVYRWVRDE